MSCFIYVFYLKYSKSGRINAPDGARKCASLCFQQRSLQLLMCKTIIFLKKDKYVNKKVNNILTTFYPLFILLHLDYAKH